MLAEQNSTSILSTRLFGSQARKENDLQSDKDVLVIIDENTKNLSSMQSHIQNSSNDDISVYTDKRIKQMFDEGHLFAWHLYLESKPLDGSKNDIWFYSLGRPALYTSEDQDISDFIKILGEALIGFKNGKNIIFEAGLCHLACRNLGLFLSYKTTQTFDFSRYAAINLAPTWKLDIEKSLYDQLVMCRRISSRGQSLEEISHKQLKIAITKIILWLTFLKKTYDFSI